MVALIGKKIGMTQFFHESGECVPVTVLDVSGNRVSHFLTKEKDGYDALCVLYGENKKERRKVVLKQYKDGKSPLLKKEFRGFQYVNNIELNQELGADLFEKTSYVDVAALSKGKGFQGVMRRHGFSGGPASHGSHFHRAPGSIGNCSDPARVFKGKKMPGRMGGKKTTVQNLNIVRVDLEANLLLIKGSVPGNNNGFVVVRTAVKK